MKNVLLKLLLLSLGVALFTMCVPPSGEDEAAAAAEERRLDSLRQVRCPRLLSSAAEYYKNRDWASTTRVYNDIVELGCDRGEEEEVYLYYAIAFEFLSRYDSSEYVLLKGLQKLPDNLPLRKRLAYAYKKQNKTNLETIEYEKIVAIDPRDTGTMAELAKLYKVAERYRDQISVLKTLLDINPNNEEAQSEFAQALEKTGGDPLEVYIDRAKQNPENVSYKVDLANRFLNAGRAGDATAVIKDGLRLEPNSKPLTRLLGDAYFEANDLANSALAYEDLFKLDPRDLQLAIKISEVYVLDEEYGKAFRWANKALSIAPNSGEAYGQKGNVYYKSFQVCRTSSVTNPDRIMASLAYRNFIKAEELGSRKFSGSKRWLEENEKDVMFRKQEWFMLTPQQQSVGSVQPTGDCYNWVEEKLTKDPSW
ncbi:MAG: hypothetical protein ABIA75_05235 [Candidatus Neomarinimicrobiota bacterium]